MVNSTENEERDPLEDRIQAEIYTWFRNEWPQHKRLLAYNFNNSRNKVEGNKNRSMGLIKGRSDMEFAWMGSTTFIEIKTPTGIQRPDQKDFQSDVEGQGFKYYIVRSLKEAQDIIYNVMELLHCIPN